MAKKGAGLINLKPALRIGLAGTWDEENMLTILVLLLLSHTAHTVAVVAIVVVRRIDVRRVEVQVVGVVAIVDRRRPIVAVRPGIVQRARVDVARTDKPQRANQAASCTPIP